MPAACVTESFSVGLGALANTVDAVATCLERAIADKPSHLNGCSTAGCTFTLTAEPTHTVRVTELKGLPATQAWQSEVCALRDLGAAGLAPRVHKHFDCNGYGYVVSDAATAATRTRAGPTGGIAVIRDGTVDHLPRMTTDDQHELAKCLQALVERGMVHMHCTLESLGFVATSNQAVVIDLRGLQPRTWGRTPRDKLWAWALCLFQMLERVPTYELEATEIYTLATAAMTGGYTWGADFSLARGLPLGKLAGAFKVADAGGFSTEAKKQAEVSANADIYQACMHYAALLPLSPNARTQQAQLVRGLQAIRQAAY